jgi:lipid-binding SYLF domain-containing protein
MNSIRHWLLALSLLLASTFGLLSQSALAATAAELNANGSAALNRLYAQSNRAHRYGRDARAILVFPKIVKAGFVIGGQGGEGVLFVRVFRPVGSHSATRCF